MSYRSSYIQSKPIPIMDMYFSESVSIEEFQLWLEQVQTLIVQKQSFVLVMQTEVNTTFPEEYRQVQAVWYKRFKADFFQYCIGLVRIAQDQADRDRLNTPALHAAWRVPYYVTLDHQDALQWAMGQRSCKI